MKCRTISGDLAKSVFQVCGVNQNLKPQFNKKLTRRAFVDFMAQQPPTRVVMEACYSSHYWGRELTKLGHHVCLIPAQHVTPFVRGNKNDHNDALAIAEASQRPNIRFVPIKTEHQQEILAFHRIRERLLKTKTALTNQTRGLLSDFGVIFSKGERSFVVAARYVEKHESLSANVKKIVAIQYQEYKEITEKLKEINDILKAFLNQTPRSAILMSIPGIGPIIASALLAAIDKGQAFNNPRDFAVWLGLTPRQYASGTSSKMGKISKRGDRYLRKQLIHGARSFLTRYKNKDDSLYLWASAVAARRGFNKAVVAAAHRIARLAWILLQKNTPYQVQIKG